MDSVKMKLTFRATQRQFSENICSEDDLRCRIFGTFVVKFSACMLLVGFSARKSEQMKNSQGIKICPYLSFKYKNTFNNVMF